MQVNGSFSYDVPMEREVKGSFELAEEVKDSFD